MNVSVETPLGYVKRGTFRPGQTIAELYREQGLPPSVPVICVLNGKPLLRRRMRGKKILDYRRWEMVRVRQRDEVAFVCTLQDGGGGKNILRTVALIGIAIAAAAIVGPGGLGIAEALGGGVIGTIGASLVSAGIVVGGAFLLSVLLPVKPAAADPNTGVGAAGNVSPTYSLQPTGNLARLMQPIPKQYGRHKIVPDFIAQPYSRYHGNEQFVYEVFSLGLGTYERHQVLIGDSIVWDESVVGFYTGRFSNIQIEFYEPNSQVTLFQTGVDVSPEVANQELRSFNTGDYIIGGQTLTIVADETIGYSLLGFKSGDSVIITDGSNDGAYVIDSVDSASQITLTTAPPSPGAFPGGSIGLNVFTGPYSATRSGRLSDTIELDFVFPNGLGHVEDDGTLTTRTVTLDVYRRIITDTGEPVSGYDLIASYSYTNATQQPQRISEVITGIGANRIEVAIVRTSDNTTLARDLLELHWTGLKGYFGDDDTFADITTMAVITRAGSELSSAGAKSFSVIQTAKVPIYDGSTFSAPTASQSIAWAAADLLRNTDYGLGLSDSQIDLTALYSLDLTWQGRNDTFNFVFDSQQSAWEALKTILATGRAKPVLVSSIITFVRDVPSTLPIAMFTPRNMKRGTAEFTHVLIDDNTPNAVTIEFVNEDTWSQDEVTCSVTGSTEDNPARITIPGITNAAQATREGNFIAAGNAFRRIFVTFSSELEGKLLISGDTIAVAHDVMSWQTSGELVDYDGDAELTLSEPINWAGGDQDYVLLSSGLNFAWGPVLVRQKDGTDNVAVVDPTSRAAIEATSGPLSEVAQFNRNSTQPVARFIMGEGANDFKRAKVLAITPQDMNSIQILAVVDDDRVYVN